MAGVDQPKRSAIIIAAWRASEWIGQCLDSWSEVSVPAGWEIDIRIGVDGCPETAETLDTLSVPYRYSTENVGPYLIRNALIQEAPADAYAIFDADDLVDPGYLEALLPKAMPDGIAGSARRSMDEDGEVLVARHTYVNGVCVISHPAWEKLGGYRPWPMAADHDLIHRAKAMGIPVRKHGEPLYSRRTHPASLTERPDTHMRSAVRRDLKRASHRAIVDAKVRQASLRVEPECAEFR